MLGLHLVLLALHELFTIRISYLVILTKVFNSYYYFKCLCTNLQLATYPNTYKLDPPPKKMFVVWCLLNWLDTLMNT